MRANHSIVIALLLVAGVSKAAARDVTIQGLPPVVVRTIPESGSAGVDPGLAEIRVTFSKDMLDGAWSCVNLSKEAFPTSAGKPRFERDRRTFVFPVRLEAGRTYAILFNSEKHKNFMDSRRIAAMPYLLVFETRKQ